MKAIIRDSTWHGEQGINHARTIKTPRQPIPTFPEVIKLLMKVCPRTPVDLLHFCWVPHARAWFLTFPPSIPRAFKPENHHVKFNVSGVLRLSGTRRCSFLDFIRFGQVDVKVQNDPNRLFRLMHEVISAQPNWEDMLAPRIILGLWHPKFIDPSKKYLPYLKRAHIGKSTLSYYVFRSMKS